MAKINQFDVLRPNGKLLGVFTGTGAVRTFGSGMKRYLANSWEMDNTETPTQSARLFVGLDVGAGKGKHKMQDVIDITRGVRVEQSGSADGSFIAQKGIYTHSEGDLQGVVVEEDSVQIILLDLEGVSKSEWERQMVQLAKYLARGLQQESVIVQLMENDVLRKTVGVDTLAA